ncbi:unnamed protein product [Linum tenue]|uniref:non-specific serine/threonine protein kinase n=1 Tax=Linum tenue TaxID=586396 RepID=A0AAV0J347_9ROSI|nr:unnamed protein product [Linum tenue]
MVFFFFITSFASSVASPDAEILLSFKGSLQNPIFLSSWNDSVPHCTWVGVSCQLGRVTSLALASTSLRGHIPASVFSLSTLVFLDLSSNALVGEIPPQIGQLKRLRQLSLSQNQLSGEIPGEIGGLTHLRSLKLGLNSLTGEIPAGIGRLTRLDTLDLSGNGLSGALPVELGELTQLQFLDLGNNRFSGHLPGALFTKLQSLTSLDISNNSFSGSIPPEIGNLTSLVDLYIGTNSFSGQLPPEIGALSRLENFIAPSCSIAGPLPDEIAGMSSLSKLDLSYNPLGCRIPNSIGQLKNLTMMNLVYAELNGSIPAELGSCRNLKMLTLSFNSLSGSLPEELSGLPLLTFSAEKNEFTGPLPPWFGKWTQMESLLLSGNKFEGRIPTEIGNCSSLQHISLSDNLLSGEIPREICNAVSLQEIDLNGNFLSGNMDEVFLHCSNLTQLVLDDNRLGGGIPGYLTDLPLMVIDLDSNNFSGSIPVSLWSSETLMEFSAGNNQLEGILPREIWKAGSLQRLVLNNNQLRGTIPKEIGNLTALSVLNLNSNFLEGSIPFELGNCGSLTTLDLGNNRLNGSIPDQLADLGQLQCLVLSHNNLSGPIPSKPCNNKLCGGVLGTHCEISRIEKSSLLIWLVSGLAIGFTILSLTIAFCLRQWVTSGSRRSNAEEIEVSKLDSLIDQNHLYFLNSSRSREPLSINVAMFEQPLRKLTLGNILEATNNFRETNIIGDGGFGTVYKATLRNGNKVAVKKLSQAKAQGDREFVAEMETLGKVKHQNLVSLLGYCSFGEEKLLVYQYMVNGSLDMWLRNRTGRLEVLDWNKRLKIAVGSARGLKFLHHGFHPHIIHRDIKASNILLNEDFEPKVADFGLARLISACETHVSTEIAGTLGYIPPEYGQSCRSTKKGDVYSFGVILLELVTGKEPTGPDFKEVEGGNLVGWVLQKRKKGEAVEVLDPAVLNADCEGAMLKVLQIASVCLAENPARRPTMEEVYKLLKGV